MPHRLIVLGRQVALALDRHHVQQLRPSDVAQRAERPHQLPEVVAVHGSEIAKIEALEEVALVEQPLLDGVPRHTAEMQQPGRARQGRPQPLLHAVVASGGRDLEQVVLQRPRSLVDGHVVVVENHQQVGGLVGPGVVQPLEGQAAGHRAVADDGHHLAPLAPERSGLGHAVGRRDRHRGVPSAESVVFALGHTRKAADAPQLTLGAERLEAARDDLVGIGLVADVPHDAVLRRIIDIVQRRSQLDGPQAGGQVARIDRALLDDIASQLVAIGMQLFRRELLELTRRGDPTQQSVFFRFVLFRHFTHSLPWGRQR